MGGARFKAAAREKGIAVVRIGTAGWTIPRAEAAHHPVEGSHLERYAGLYTAAEINSSFHRPHRASTYERWAGSVPSGFRFSVKLPKSITHKARLKDAEGPLEEFLAQVEGLGESFGCLLVQLPPSLSFECDIAAAFFHLLRARCEVDIACEPRHGTWLEGEADALLVQHRIARVAADPEGPDGASEPGGWGGLRYFRLHGSPRMYYSSYAPEYLEALAERLRVIRTAGITTWCIFDNTTQGAATGNARTLLNLLLTGGAAGTPSRPPDRSNERTAP